VPAYVASRTLDDPALALELCLQFCCGTWPIVRLKLQASLDGFREGRRNRPINAL
jgi:hypothetical protein